MQSFTNPLEEWIFLLSALVEMTGRTVQGESTSQENGEIYSLKGKEQGLLGPTKWSYTE